MSVIKHQGTQEDLDDMASKVLTLSDFLVRNQVAQVLIPWVDIYNLANSYIFLYNKTMEKGILPPPSERGKPLSIH